MTIDIRDLIAQLIATPVKTLGTLVHLMLHNLATGWYWMLTATVLFFTLRWRLLRAARTERAPRRTTTRRAERARARRSMLGSVTLFLAWCVYGLVMLGQLGIVLSSNTTGWFLGASSVAIALAAQGAIRDVLAGWHILAEDQYGVGDYIDLGLEFAGTVLSIGLRSTRLRGADGTIFHVRNSDINRLGNRTQSSGALLLDIELCPERFVTSDEVDEWGMRVVEATVSLRETLHGVRGLAVNRTPGTVSVEDIADVVPTLAPNLTADTLESINLSADVEAVHHAIRRAPAGTTPVFRDIELLGLVNSTPTSITLRLRVRLLEQSSRSYAMALLRRRVFDEFAPDEVATGFHDVPEGDVIN